MSAEPHGTAGAQAAGPLGGGHAALARGLDVAEADRAGAGADEYRPAAGLQLAGSEVLTGVIDSDGTELETHAVELGPGARVGGARADLAVHHVRGQLPVHVRVGRSDLGGEAHALGWLRDGLDRALLDPVQRRDEQFGP